MTSPELLFVRRTPADHVRLSRLPRLFQVSFGQGAFGGGNSYEEAAEVGKELTFSSVEKFVLRRQEHFISRNTSLNGRSLINSHTLLVTTDPGSLSFP